jgi:hypothetical protein
MIIEILATMPLAALETIRLQFLSIY